MNVKIIVSVKKKFGGILAHAFMIASIADISVIECD